MPSAIRNSLRFHYPKAPRQTPSSSSPFPSLQSSREMATLISSAFCPFPCITKWTNAQMNPSFLKISSKSPLVSPIFHHSSRSTKSTVSSLSPKASVSGVEYVVEPSTDVKFAKEVTVPGCSDSLVLLGTGYREKFFAIIGVKVYAAGFYTKLSVRQALELWRGKSENEVLDDSSLFSSIFHAPLEKSLKIKLVRDVDGKTFWNALNDVITPRIKEPTTIDESALSTFRDAFETRDLKKGTLIILTWIEPSKMLVSISSDVFPAHIDAEIESVNVTSSLFDAFFGESPVSPTLKASVANGLVMVLK